MAAIDMVTAATEQQKISVGTAEAVKQWLTQPEYAEFVADIERLVAAEDWQAIEDNFFKHISFGTGGMRGAVGVGPNRINERTLGEAAMGFITYLKTVLPAGKTPQIVLGYDMRLTHEPLSKHVASVLAANGAHVYRFDGWRATPELGFAIRQLKADAGIVISASHNPPGDNGFKAYWTDGGQIVPPHDEKIMEAVAEVKEIPFIDYDQAVAEGTIEAIGAEVDEGYWKAILNESLSDSRSLKIVYSPIHGCGQRSLLPVLERAGFSVDRVESQMVPDGHFPNVPNGIANPEVATANEAAGAQLLASGADLAFTTDPDADRIACLVPDVSVETGYQVIGGNKLAALVTAYVLTTLKEQNKLPAKGFIVRTMVTTAMMDAIAERFGVKSYNDLLVGIKYITRAIFDHQDNGDETFIVGGEESYGMLKGSYTRDKDAAVTGLMLAEYASILKDQGKTLLEALEDLYREYGYFLETQIRTPFPGASGFAAMNAMMAAFRDNPPKTLAGMPVVSTKEYVQDARGAFVVRFFLTEDGRNVVTARPSGTEPITKFYVALCDESAKGAQDLAPIKAALAEKAKAIEADLKAFAEKYAK